MSNSMSVLEAHAWFSDKAGREHADAFALADDLLTIGRSYLSGPINRNDERKVIASILFGRVLHAVTGCVLMIRAGLPAQADTLFRSSMEAGFRLGAIAKDPNNIAYFVAEGPPIREEAMRDLQRHINKGGVVDERITMDSIEMMLEKIQHERETIIAQRGVALSKPLGFYKWAEAAGQLDLFWMKYVLTSQAAHHNVRDADRLFTRDAQGDPEHLSFVPTFDGKPDSSVADVMVILAHAAEAFCSIMELDATAFSDRYSAVLGIHARDASDPELLAELDKCS